MNVHDAIHLRRSVRAYSSRPIPPDVLDRLKCALRSAPSACNRQPWRFILATDADLRRQIGQLANEQFWIADAPLVVIACGLTAEAYPRMCGRYNSVDVDVSIALDHLTLAAVAEGLGTCWIGAFPEEQMKKLLGVPAAAKIVALMPVGYPASPELNHPLDDTQRKPPREIFATDRFA